MNPNFTDLSDEPAARRAVVADLYREDGFGYLRAADGRDVRFDRDSVLRGEFDLLEVGSEVLFQTTEGGDGFDAVAVDLVSRRLPGADDTAVAEPDPDNLPEMPSVWSDDENDSEDSEKKRDRTSFNRTSFKGG